MHKQALICLLLTLSLASPSVQKSSKPKKRAERIISCYYDKFCTSCGKDKICNRCSTAYVNRMGICQIPTVYIPNCAVYISPEACLECDFGYSMVGNNQCVAITLSDCAVIDATTPTKCGVCSNGFAPDGTGLCSATTPCAVDNCEVCGNLINNRCVRCKAGFMLSPNLTCVAQTIKNCVQAEDSRCTLCEKGYFHNKNKCVWSNVQNKNMISSSNVFSAIVALLLVWRATA